MMKPYFWTIFLVFTLILGSCSSENKIVNQNSGFDLQSDEI